jgi:hypothetical protein
MKKSLLFISMLVAGAFASFAQKTACTPNPLIDTAATTIQFLPDSNVVITANINALFTQVVTVFVPTNTSFDTPPPVSTYIKSINATVDSIKIDTITGLPAGVSYSCGKCVMYANQPYCLTISGTMPNVNNILYKLSIKGSPYGQLNPTIVSQSQGFLKPNIEDNGTFTKKLPLAGYKVKVGNPVITGINNFSLNGSFNVSQNIPNPFDGSTTINFNATGNGNIDFTVTDILGRNVYDTNINATLGSNTFVFTTDLANGTYFFSLSDGKNTVTRKMVISK